jgi:fructokinase
VTEEQTIMPKAEPRVIVGLGEIHWDIFPEGARLGGAPANFAVMAGRLGNHAVVASRLGEDDLGSRALQILESMPVETEYLQKDATYATGTVTVSMATGEPEYVIHEPVAWDRLTSTPQWEDLAQRADAVCFGTLAQRSAASRTAIQNFLNKTRPDCVRIFDVNLRPPFWSADVLRESLGRAIILKLNAFELPQVLLSTGACPHPTDASDEEEILRGARRLLERYPVQLICVTMGPRGSLLATRSEFHRHPGLAAKVKDTVGAGDAFTAALAHYYLEQAPLPILNEAGNRWGAWVASQSGGMPPLSEETLAAIRAAIDAHRISSATDVGSF